MNLNELIKETRNKGYSENDAKAKVCQDIILEAIAKSPLSNNVTIKGGVVMRNITNNERRATQDIDIDFIRYSLSDDSIDGFIDKINCLEYFKIIRIGKIYELNQQDYHGKSIRIEISDRFSNHIETKIDLGVHTRLEINQDEYCFDVCTNSQSVSLLINSKEQMVAEKLKSLLKFGKYSTRYKDIYDIYYFCHKLDNEKLNKYLNILIYSDIKMVENNIEDITKRIEETFSDKRYKEAVNTSDKKWLDDDIETVFKTITNYLKELS